MLFLTHLYEAIHDSLLANETHKNQKKSQYDKYVCPRIFSEGGLVVVYDQYQHKLGSIKLEPLWYGPYIIKCVLSKGAYVLVDLEGNQNVGTS